MSQRVMGTVHTSSFEDIWNAEPYREFREQLLSSEPPPECRGCARGSWWDPYELEDWMTVGVNDVFGIQLGTGWSAATEGTRWTRKQALLRLRNSGRRRLQMSLVSSPYPSLALTQRGSVWANDVEVGGFEISSIDPIPVVYNLPDLRTPALSIRIVCEREHIPRLMIGNEDVRRLGIGLRSAELID